MLLDAIDRPIRLVSTDHAFYLRRIVTTPFRPPGTPGVGELAAEACADGVNCIVLSKHGCAVIAETVELAHKRAMYLEEAARMTYRALAVNAFDTMTECPTDWLEKPGRTTV